jgi:SOS response regulatory protein OraA/RecX
MASPKSSPVVLRLERIPRKGEYLVTFSDGTELKVLKDDLAASGIEEGAAVDRERIAGLEAVYRQGTARRAALRLLKVRPRTELELRRRLHALDAGTDATDAVIRNLKAQGLVDDRVFARLWVREKAQRGGTGRLRIRHDLETRGIHPDVVKDELDRSFSYEEESRAADDLARRKFKRLRAMPAGKAKGRVYSYLVGKGFTSGVASEAARRAVELAGGTAEDED